MRTLICTGLLLLVACSQDSGESCQKQSDCADNLICDIAPRSDRGVCRTEPKDVDVDDSVDELPVAGDDAGTDNDAG